MRTALDRCRRFDAPGFLRLSHRRHGRPDLPKTIHTIAIPAFTNAHHPLQAHRSIAGGDRARVYLAHALPCCDRPQRGGRGSARHRPQLLVVTPLFSIQPPAHQRVEVHVRPASDCGSAPPARFCSAGPTTKCARRYEISARTPAEYFEESDSALKRPASRGPLRGSVDSGKLLARRMTRPISPSLQKRRSCCGIPVPGSGAVSARALPASAIRSSAAALRKTNARPG